MRMRGYCRKSRERTRFRWPRIVGGSFAKRSSLRAWLGADDLVAFSGAWRRGGRAMCSRASWGDARVPSAVRSRVRSGPCPCDGRANRGGGRSRALRTRSRRCGAESDSIGKQAVTANVRHVEDPSCRFSQSCFPHVRCAHDRQCSFEPANVSWQSPAPLHRSRIGSYRLASGRRCAWRDRDRRAVDGLVNDHKSEVLTR